jgi:hypothetical protein
VDPNNTRLRIANRIHLGLLRHLGEGIDVATMLRNDAEAREVLWVCQASGDGELVALSRQFERANALEAAGGHTPQDTTWARDTSGFGLSQPPELPQRVVAAAAKPAASGRWLKPVTSWLRRSAP